jgi:hypothetical protein
MARFPSRRRPAQSDELEGFVLFEGGVERAAETLITGAAAMEAEVIPTEALQVDESLAQEDSEAAASRILERLGVLKELTEARSALSGLLVRRMLIGEETAPDADLRAASERVDAAAAAVAGLLGVDLGRAKKHKRELAVAAVAERVREISLEEFDASLHLVRHRSGRLGVAWQTVAPETASVWLLDSLFERVERSLELDPLLKMERQASRWWFLRWSAERRGEEFQFTQGVREQEWSLADRPAVVTNGVPVIEAFQQQPMFEAIPPRQQQLARALPQSVVGAFTFRGKEDDIHIFEAASDGQRYRVHEHNPSNAYPPGAIGLGRLIPWSDDGLHLRSPGMVITGGSEPELASRLAEAMEKSGEANMSPAIALEALISVLLMGAKVPRRVKPAESRVGARETSQRLVDLLQEYGLTEETTPDELDPEEISEEMRRMAKERGLKLLSYQVDEIVADWLGELHKMANPMGSPAGSLAGGSGKRKGKNKKKRGR